METLKLFGHSISRTDAIQLAHNYRNFHNVSGNGTIHINFTFSEISDFFKYAKLRIDADYSLPKGELAMRIYLAKIEPKIGGRRTIFLVPTIKISETQYYELSIPADGNDKVAYDFGTLCPPQCDLNNEFDKHSIAYEAYTRKSLKKKKTKSK